MASSFNIFGLGKPKSYLGVDIGTLSIKLVELSNENGRPKLENYGILSDYGLAAADFLQNGQVQQTQKVFGGQAAAMLKKLFMKTGIAVPETNMSVPIFSSFLTVMELPAMPEAELSSAIQFEAKKYVPVPLDSVVVDWSLVGANAENKVQVLLIAIPKELINEYSTIAREANLKLLNIELETVSAARSLIGNDPTPSVLIDMGHRDTTISIVDRAFLRISHSVETSGEDLTRALSQNLNVSWRRAEELKKQNGIKAINSNDQMIKVLTPMIDIIADAASNVIDLYISRSKKKVEKLIVYGGAAKMPGFAEYISNRLKIDFTVGNPFGRINYPEKLKPAIKEIGHEFSVAIGLALKALQ